MYVLDGANNSNNIPPSTTAGDSTGGRGRTATSGYHATAQSEGSIRLVSLSNFAEIIMAPSEPGIVTAAGNWQARLAAASIGINKGHVVVLKPRDCCWSCLSRVTINGATSISSILADRRGRFVLIL